MVSSVESPGFVAVGERQVPAFAGPGAFEIHYKTTEFTRCTTGGKWSPVQGCGPLSGPHYCLPHACHGAMDAVGYAPLPPADFVLIQIEQLLG